jgi:aminoglycoside 6'-N-acetyltransferase
MYPVFLELPEQLESQRLILRPFRAGDGEWYYPMSQRNREHLLPYEGNNPAMSIQSPEDAEKLVRAFAADWALKSSFFLAALDKESGAFVAQIYVGVVDWGLPEFELGYFVERERQGQGYVTEAAQRALHFIFRELKAERLSLSCDDSNERSYRVAERCGMVREGHIRANRRWPDGRVTGTLHYGMLRSEYEARYGAVEGVNRPARRDSRE